MLDLPAYIAARALLSLLNMFPLALRLRICGFLIRSTVFLVPKYRRIALRNISLVFPEMDGKGRENLFDESLRMMARFIVDAARIQTVDLKWVREHVSVPALPHEGLRAAHAGKGILIATGHLGSFELMARASSLLGQPLSFVVRNFNLKRLDSWWTRVREETGNRVISRAGAFNEIVREIEMGRDMGVLFDQNVKRNHAVFVPFFGRPAATTKSVALAALRTSCAVMVASISYEGNERYALHAECCDFDELYADTNISRDEKIAIITERVTRVFEDMIRAHPTEWFWMHRRWKTTPEGVPEDFYA